MTTYYIGADVHNNSTELAISITRPPDLLFTLSYVLKSTLLPPLALTKALTENKMLDSLCRFLVEILGLKGENYVL